MTTDTTEQCSTGSAVNVDIEPTAAEQVDEGECDYRDCNNTADYRVQIEAVGSRAATTVLMCDDCSRQNHIWVRENELLRREVTADV